MGKSKKRLIIAVVFGVLAATAMAFYASGVRAEASLGRETALQEYGGDLVEVFVASRDIAAGETLSAENCSVQLWVADLLPVGVIRQETDVYEKTAAVAFLQNEPIVATRLGEVSSPIIVPDGLCAVSIPSDDVLAVGGAVIAGGYVNVYAADGEGVELMAEEILVLETSSSVAFSQASAKGQSGALAQSEARSRLAWVTLAVDPDSVQELIAASVAKQLHIVVPGDGVDE